MMTFRGTRLQDARLPLSTVWLLETLAESKGRQQLFENQFPQILTTLREMALIQSTESSNRIEGVTVDKSRLRPLVLGKTRPRDRSEEEIVGYRLALNWIHTDYRKIPITPETCLRLHALAQGGTSGDVGQWKTTPNDIIEILPDDRRQVRFRPLPPEQVPEAMALSPEREKVVNFARKEENREIPAFIRSEKSSEIQERIAKTARARVPKNLPAEDEYDIPTFLRKQAD